MFGKRGAGLSSRCAAPGGSGDSRRMRLVVAEAVARFGCVTEEGQRPDDQEGYCLERSSSGNRLEPDRVGLTEPFQAMRTTIHQPTCGCEIISQECFFDRPLLVFQEGGQQSCRNLRIRGLIRLGHQGTAQPDRGAILPVVESPRELNVPPASKALTVRWALIPQVCTMVIEVKEMPVGG